MANLEITNNASASIQIWSPKYKIDQTFLAAAAINYPAGVVLALNTTTAKYEVYVSGGADGVGTPSAILPFAVDASAGAGDFPITAIIGGEVRYDKIGVSPTLVGLSPAEVLNLQDFTIIASPTNQLGELDNQ